MTKRITTILSLTVVLLTTITIGFNKFNSNTTSKENNKIEEFSPELASVYETNISTKTVEIKNEANEIAKINAELLALEDDIEVYAESAKTSYYHDKFNGRKTASGAIFNNEKYTAAHKTLPFGSKLRVTNNENEESVIVTVNDRGPFIKGRQLDLSKQAFLDITHNKHSGVLNVKIEVLPEDYQENKQELEENLDEFIL